MAASHAVLSKWTDQMQWRHHSGFGGMSVGYYESQILEKVEFTVDVKLLRDGACLVRAGFYKDGEFLRGLFSGKEYWKDHTVHGQANRTYKIVIVLDRIPPSCRQVQVEVYDP